MSKTKLTILFTVLIDIIGLGIIIPVIPFYVARYSSSPLILTSLFAVYSLCSFMSTPFLGALSDRIGRRPILIVSILSTAIGWFMFASAHSVVWLFVGRIIDGLAAGNISTAQSYLVDISKDDKERSHNLGLIGACFGIGFVIGPGLGGLLGEVSPSFPFWFVSGMAFVNVLMAFFNLPETHKNTDPNKRIELNPLLPIVRAVKDKLLLPTYAIWLLFGVATSGMQAIFALYLSSVFNLSSLYIGLLMAAQGVLISLNQAVGLKHFWLRFFKEPDLEFYLLIIFGFAFALMSLPWLIVFIVGILISVFTQSVLRVVVTSQAMGKAGTRGRGEILGIMSSVMSLGMIIGPLMAGPAYTIKPSLPFLISAVAMVIAFGIGYYNRKHLAQLELTEDESANAIF